MEEVKIREPRIRPKKSPSNDGHRSQQSLPSTIKLHEINLELKIDEINDHKEKNVVGEDWTLIALKNPTSYLIATEETGLKVIENSKEVYAGPLPKDNTRLSFFDILSNLIYVQEGDYYLIHYMARLWRKNIDQSPLFIFMDNIPKFGDSSLVIYSRVHSRLVIGTTENVMVINPQNKHIEILIRFHNIGDKKVGLNLFGEQKTQLIMLTELGFVALFTFNFFMRKILRSNHSKIDHFYDSQEEKVADFALCDRGKYILVQLGDKGRKLCSKKIVFEVTRTGLTAKASLREDRLQLDLNINLEFLGYFGDDGYVLWLGFPQDKRFVMVFGYEIERNQLRELVEKRVDHCEYDATRPSRQGNEFYFTGIGRRF